MNKYSCFLTFVASLAPVLVTSRYLPMFSNAFNTRSALTGTRLHLHTSKSSADDYHDGSELDDVHGYYLIDGRYILPRIAFNSLGDASHEYETKSTYVSDYSKNQKQAGGKFFRTGDIAMVKQRSNEFRSPKANQWHNRNKNKYAQYIYEDDDDDIAGIIANDRLYRKHHDHGSHEREEDFFFDKK